MFSFSFLHNILITSCNKVEKVYNYFLNKINIIKLRQVVSEIIAFKSLLMLLITQLVANNCEF